MGLDQEHQLREQLSALADGEMAASEWPQVLQYAHGDAGRQAWYAYQVIGDALRSPELAHTSSAPAFLAALHQRMAQEPGGLQPAANLAQAPVQPVVRPHQEAANQDLFRWKLIAGVASLAAVSVLGWNVFESTQGPAAGAQWAQLANRQAVVPVQVAQQPVAAPSGVQAVADRQGGRTNAEALVMLRDPRLDELLAARRQYGGANALQMPASFLRNTTLDEAPR